MPDLTKNIPFSGGVKWQKSQKNALQLALQLAHQLKKEVI